MNGARQVNGAPFLSNISCLFACILEHKIKQQMETIYRLLQSITILPVKNLDRTSKTETIRVGMVKVLASLWKERRFRFSEQKQRLPIYDYSAGIG